MLMTANEIKTGETIEILGVTYRAEKVGRICVEMRGPRGGMRGLTFRPDGSCFMSWGGYRSRKAEEVASMLIGSHYWISPHVRA